MDKKQAIYIILIVLQIGVIIYFVRRGRRLRRELAAEAAEPVLTEYESLRSTALQVTPVQLKLAIPATSTLVYGVVMDCNMGDAIVTLSAYITGAVSMYFSTGGGKGAGGMDPAVAELAVEVVTAAQHYIHSTVKAADHELPLAGCVRFYLLTNKGTYLAQEQLTFFEDSSSAWLPLFEKSNELISLMHSEGNGFAH